MLSLIEVECPHCGARGQIMVPPVGAIIIGPCPQCKELVVVFCGQALPLDRALMEGGSTEERQEHLMSVLTQFLGDRISNLFQEEGFGPEEAMNDDFESLNEETSADDGVPDDGAPDDGAPEPKTPRKVSEITQSEFKRFIEVDLKLLDNPAYFRSVFE